MMFKLGTAAKAVFLASVVILAMLPFLNSYLHGLYNEKDEFEQKIETKTEELVEGLSKLKAATTLFDHFVDEREKRKVDRLAERQKAIELQKRKLLEAASYRNSESNPRTARTSSPTKPWIVGPVQRYIEDHNGALPIVVVCHNRPRELGETLDGLLALPNVDRDLILVLQDGTHEQVKIQAIQRGLQIVQNIDLERSKIKEGGERIASHYRFSLRTAFERFADAPAIIIMEDDLQPAPDFLEWFAAGAGLLENDPTLWCVSAWNDNGFKGLVNDIYGVKRTVLFPGLGWLLLRSEYTERLQSTWPADNWDWFVRGVYQRQERECLYPEISRTFHAGRVGTFVSEKDQAAIFDRMERVTGKNLDWTSEAARRNLMLAMLPEYDERIQKILEDNATIHVKDATKFESLFTENCPAVVVWFAADPDPRFETGLVRFAKMFGIWHQLIRASHEGMHEIMYKGCRLLLINVFEPRHVFSTWFTSYIHQSKFAPYRPNGVPIFKPDDFVDDAQDIEIPKGLTMARDFGDSCTKTCQRSGRTCRVESFQSMNHCRVLKMHFPCTACEASSGDDQPCYVSPTAPKQNLPGTCLVTTGSQFTCDGKHELTKRLCHCI